MSPSYQRGSGLEVPGIEGTFKYGDSSNALIINDRSQADQVHVSEISGLHDDPDVSDSRTDRASRWGERPGLMMPRGRTLGLTGFVQSGNVNRMRDLWRRTRAQFGLTSQDLTIYPPADLTRYVNEVWTGQISSWLATMPAATVPAMTIFTDGKLSGIEEAATGAPASINALTIAWATPITWSGEDVWMAAIVRAPTAAATPTSIALGATFSGSSSVWTATGTGAIASPVAGNYYLLYARLPISTSSVLGATAIVPRVVMTTPATAGAYTLRVAQATVCLLNSADTSPAGIISGDLPGFEYEGAIGRSRSYGPSYVANQVSDPTSSTATLWANDSTAGVTVDVAGLQTRSWPGGQRNSISWALRNPNTTSRTLAVRSPATNVDPDLYVVSGQRSYRVHVRAYVDESFAQGQLSIVWLDRSLATISTSVVTTFSAVSAVAPNLDLSLDGVVVAPALAVRAYMRVNSATASTTTNDRLTVFLADPCFNDVSEYDPGYVAIDDTQYPEHGVLAYTPFSSGTSIALAPDGARRRVPRPFLVRSARALWDGKAPESQRSLMPRRDFTMSLRASDPRIYVIDERHSQIKASGVPKMVRFLSSNSFYPLLSAPEPMANYDDFITMPAGVLNGRVPPNGLGTWVTSGATTDYVQATISSNAVAVARSTVSDSGPRFAILGATSYPTIHATIVIDRDALNAGNDLVQGVLVRWVDSSNYLKATLFRSSTGSTTVLNVQARVAGVDQASLVFKTIPWGLITTAEYTVDIFVYPSGRVIAFMTENNYAFGSSTFTIIVREEAFSSALATGGALATGKPGIYDYNAGGTVVNRYYGYISARTMAADLAGALPGFTLEGASVALKTGWSNSSSGGSYPRQGVALSRTNIAAIGKQLSLQGSAATGFLAQDSLMRMYRSLEAYTYTTPQVTVAGDCISQNNSSYYDLFTGSLIGGAWQYNSLVALVKRVSATTWLELRYNSANSVVMNAFSASPAAPFSLELWCSHNVAGTLTTTRLDGWDVPAGVVTSGDLKFLRASLSAGNVLSMELWEGTDPNANDIGLISRRDYTLSASLITLLGAAVAGQSGLALKLARWSDAAPSGVDLVTMAAGYGFPYVSSFEALDYVAGQLWISCPVIGDADDVPWTLQLQGSIDSPTITLISLGETKKTSTIRLSGVFTDADPVIIDFDAGTIKSSSGVNLFSTRQAGSKFSNLSAGQNFVLIQALAWDTAAPVHAIASWQDALA